MSLTWYVMHSKPNQEELLRNQLRSREITVFLPRSRANPVNPRARKFKPFFPGYLFVQVDLEDTPLSSLAWVPGAIRMVSFDGEPAIVSDHVIEALKQNVSQINTSGKANKKDDFKHGDPVRIKSGAFKGYEAIFDTSLDDQSRVCLLIQMLQDRKLRLKVPRELVTRK